MKIKPLFLAVALSFPFTASAQKKTPSFLEFQTDIYPGGGNPAIGFKYGLFKEIDKNIRIGGGVGIMEETSFKYAPFIPLFGRAEFDLAKSGNLVPYMDFDLGYNLNCAHIKSGSIFVNPFVGLRFNNKFHLGLGYIGTATFGDQGAWANGVSLRFGATFGTNGESMNQMGNAISKFFKHTHFGLDLKGGFSLNHSIAESPYAEYKYNHFASGLLGFHWLYDINKHWATGMGLQMGVMSWNMDVEDYDANKKGGTDVDILALWRVEYTHDEIAKNLKPYADFDLGVGIGGCLISPQVGVKLKNKYRLGLAIATRTNLWEDCLIYGGDYLSPKAGVCIEFHTGIDF